MRFPHATPHEIRTSRHFLPHPYISHVETVFLMVYFSVYVQFLTGLTKLFQQTRGSGSVFLTMKKCKDDYVSGNSSVRMYRDT